jgi:NAD+ synthase (glutamine-hydrolysing)
MHGFYRVAAASPETVVAGVRENTDRILRMVKDAAEKEAAAVVFPELCLTGYTCGDLFHQSALLDGTLEAVGKIAAATEGIKTTVITGGPFRVRGALYNCAFVINSGNVAGIVPKSFIPNYREFYEKRWFSPAAGIATGPLPDADNPWGKRGANTVFSPDIVFEHDRLFRFSVEICEDLWAVIPPSSRHSLAGALVNFNLSASDELVSKAEYRHELIKQQSARCVSGYVYTSSGVGESSTDLVFGGHSIAAENGSILSESARFQRGGSMIFADIDCEKLLSLRSSESSFYDRPAGSGHCFVRLPEAVKPSKLERFVDPHPFVPSSGEERGRRCVEIFKIQSSGLAKRFEHTRSKKLVLGVSGGLDSTLALLVCAETCKILGRPASDITALTMPGFGTSDRTYSNASALCRKIGADMREISIKDACLKQFAEIGHDPARHDAVYENVQARQRTMLLMSTANKAGGLVVGTGDLSEIALGWSTYNGDHMSMYAVNCGVPKTLIRYLIQWVADTSPDKELADILRDIIDTPVSPELTPAAADGSVAQKTEEIIGPYELHDFFLYHTVKYGAPPEKILFLAEKAFAGKYSAEKIAKTLGIFVRRFFSQQFKRSCIPDGPKVGTICLSPRGDWRMPSDASPELWLSH